MQLMIDAVVYVPALHAVHELAPALLSLSVVLPGAQAMQLAVPVVGAYSPGMQVEQEVFPVRDWVSWPASHSVHEVVEAVPYVPAIHAVHELAPV